MRYVLADRRERLSFLSALAPLLSADEIELDRRPLAARRRRIRVAELEGEPMVLREVGSTTRLAFETAIRNAGVTIKPVMAIGNRESRLISAFFKTAEDLKARRAGGTI